MGYTNLATIDRQHLIGIIAAHENRLSLVGARMGTEPQEAQKPQEEDAFCEYDCISGSADTANSVFTRNPKPTPRFSVNRQLERAPTTTYDGCPNRTPEACT